MNEEEKKAIERCKKLIKETHSCWIGLSNQEAIKTILNLSEKQKVEIENKQDEINVLEAQRDSIENQFEQAKVEIEKKDKMIDEMIKVIIDSGICDYFIKQNCKHYAGENKKTCDVCLKEYFERKVENGNRSRRICKN